MKSERQQCRADDDAERAGQHRNAAGNAARFDRHCRDHRIDIADLEEAEPATLRQECGDERRYATGIAQGSAADRDQPDPAEDRAGGGEAIGRDPVEQPPGRGETAVAATNDDASTAPAAGSGNPVKLAR